jgi:hypothetical protein
MTENQNNVRCIVALFLEQALGTADEVSQPAFVKT